MEATTELTRVDWSEARTELLRAEWTAGSSAVKIAALIGAGATRSGVLGKIHRMGLSRNDQPRLKRPPREVAPKPPKGTAAAAPAVAVAAVPDPSPKPILKVETPPTPEIVAAPEPGPDVGVRYEDMRMDQCKWPLSGTGMSMRCCGAPRPSHMRPYCSAHEKKACGGVYRPAKDRDLQRLSRRGA